MGEKFIRYEAEASPPVRTSRESFSSDFGRASDEEVLARVVAPVAEGGARVVVAKVVANPIERGEVAREVRVPRPGVAGADETRLANVEHPHSVVEEAVVLEGDDRRIPSHRRRRRRRGKPLFRG